MNTARPGTTPSRPFPIGRAALIGCLGGPLLTPAWFPLWYAAGAPLLFGLAFVFLVLPCVAVMTKGRWPFAALVLIGLFSTPVLFWFSASALHAGTTLFGSRWVGALLIAGHAVLFTAWMAVMVRTALAQPPWRTRVGAGHPSPLTCCPGRQHHVATAHADW